LPWHLPSDLKFFKEVTTGKNIVMGRRTWESLPKKPLPNRNNIVISSSKQEVETFDNLSSCVEKYKNEDLYVIGGAVLYNTAMDIADELIISRIPGYYDCDTFFPEISDDKWFISSIEEKDGFSVYYYKTRN